MQNSMFVTKDIDVKDEILTNLNTDDNNETYHTEK